MKPLEKAPEAPKEEKKAPVVPPPAAKPSEENPGPVAHAKPQLPKELAAMEYAGDIVKVWEKDGFVCFKTSGSQKCRYKKGGKPPKLAHSNPENSGPKVKPTKMGEKKA